MTDIPDLLTRLARTLRDANQAITLTVPDARELHALARIGHLQVQALEAWHRAGDTPQDLPTRLTPKREAELHAAQTTAREVFAATNALLLDELRAYRQDHP